MLAVRLRRDASWRRRESRIELAALFWTLNWTRNEKSQCTFNIRPVLTWSPRLNRRLISSDTLHRAGRSTHHSERRIIQHSWNGNGKRQHDDDDERMKEWNDGGIRREGEEEDKKSQQLTTTTMTTKWTDVEAAEWRRRRGEKKKVFFCEKKKEIKENGERKWNKKKKRVGIII